MKRKLLLGFILTLGMLMMAGCSDRSKENTKGINESSTDTVQDGSDSSGKKVTVKVLQFKTELSEQMQEMAEVYMSEHPEVDLRIESVISNDYSTILKARFTSGEAPDIFNNEGYNQMELWLENLEDLSDQPWISDMIDFTKEGISKDGNIYGLPLYLESYGFLYNKDLFAQAGIETIPTTLTGLKEAIEKLEAAGIPVFAINGSEWYPNGVFLANVPMAQQDNPTEFIKQLNEGTAKISDNQLFKDWLDLVEVMKEHVKDDPLATDFTGVVSEFSNGNVAMILGTNGYQIMIDEVNPEFNLGMMPIPINDDVALNDKIFASASTYWCVNKNSNSESKEAAKEFLNWLVTFETGKKYITEDFSFIPGLKTLTANENVVGQTGIDTQKFIDADKICGWEWSKYPDGVTTDFGSIIQMYYAGEIDKKDILDSFQEKWDNLKK